jgi:ADP-heptose:LPS heptosyltransferase
MFEATGVARPEKPLLLQAPEVGVEAARKRIRALKLPEGGWVILHPGSGSLSKNWPLDGWRMLAGRLRRLGLVPVWLVGPAEAGRADAIREAAETTGEHVVDGLDLVILSGLLAEARGFIGQDSGVSHLAAGLGASTLALFGPTDSMHWAPRGPRVRVLAPEPGQFGREGWGWLTAERAAEAAVKVIG